jgi:hypothetical protein
VKIFLMILATTLSLPAFADESISGTYEGKEYSFDFDSTFNEIKGHWGEQQYQIEPDSTFNEIKGSLAGAALNLSIDTTFHETKGDSPCGTISLTYDLTFKEIQGTYCGQNFSQTFDQVEDILPTYKEMVIESFIDQIPAPARRASYRFIFSRVKF